VTDQAPDHSAFDELAAGHALDGLEPADEQRFLRHAEQCPRCRQSAADFRQVAAALARTAPPAEPSADLGARIRAAVLADPRQQDRPGIGSEPTAADGPGTTTERDAPSPPVVPLRHRPGQRWWKPAAAAAAVLIAAGGIWAGLAATAGGQQPPLAVCAQPHACSQVVLTSAATHRVAAKVIVHEGVAWLQPAKLAANPADEIYVLWQVNGANAALAVGSFDVKAGTNSPVRIGGLAVPYSRTRAFAVSLEHGRTIPASPSKPIATGLVS
jgi:hypothetical protein